VEVLKSDLEYPERRGCELVGVSRSVVRYKPLEREGESELRDRIKGLSRRHKRYGYRRVTALIRREGLIVNHKRVHRLWKEEGLALPRKRQKRRRAGETVEMVNKATRKDHVWTYDFVEDRTEKGSKLRMLNIVDEYTRECLAIRVERSIDSLKVIDTLNWLFLIRAVPGHIRSDNGPEFIAKTLKDWLGETGCKTIYIEPGSPWENSYIESFNGKLRDECLNREMFRNVAEARNVVENWRREYNEFRPHSSLDYMTPAEFSLRYGSSSRPPVSLRFHSGVTGNTTPMEIETTTKEKTLTF
jgi:transposase InsO family protein